MRIIFLLIVFYGPSAVFAAGGGIPIPPPTPTPTPAPTPTPFDTQSSLGLNAAALQNAYKLQTFNLPPFDKALPSAAEGFRANG